MTFKHYRLTLLCALWAQLLAAQTTQQFKIPQAAQLPSAPAPKRFYPLEPAAPYAPAGPLAKLGVSDRSGVEELVGTTSWDAPSYGCTARNNYLNQAGDPVINWLYSNQLSGNTDRGTANNVRANGTWGNVTARIEGATRTGFPVSERLANGTEVVIAHSTGFTPYALRMSRRVAGTTLWAGANLPQPMGIGLLWPQIAVGGPDGNTLHVIAITTPVGNQGVRYLGVDGHLLYWRSKDGGNTWDIKHQVIAGLDSTLTSNIGACNYTIDATDNYVAIGVFDALGWHDIPVLKSSDNGDSWSKIVVRDFPDALENYVPEPGKEYSEVEVNEVDTLAPTPLAMLTNDGHGALFIDPSGQVHAWFGRAYVADSDFTDTTSVYYPTANGIVYWKESYGSNNFRYITGALDYDGNGLLDITLNQLSSFNTAGPSSFPCAGMDAKGTLYLAYSAVHELYQATGLDGNDKLYRHTFLMASNDGGENWGPPLELTAPPYVEDFVVPVIEWVFPSIPRRVADDKIRVSYWSDQIPGSTIISAVATTDLTNINYLEVDKTDLLTAISDPVAPVVGMHLSPNPVGTETMLLTDGFKDGLSARVDVFDQMGRRVQQYQVPAWDNQQGYRLSVGQLAPGAYWVRMAQDGRTGIAKMVVR